jgi:hypothetical protein
MTSLIIGFLGLIVKPRRPQASHQPTRLPAGIGSTGDISTQCRQSRRHLSRGVLPRDEAPRQAKLAIRARALIHAPVAPS